jgi:hypothetical protein
MRDGIVLRGLFFGGKSLLFSTKAQMPRPTAGMPRGDGLAQKLLDLSQNTQRYRVESFDEI